MRAHVMFDHKPSAPNCGPTFVKNQYWSYKMKKIILKLAFLLAIAFPFVASSGVVSAFTSNHIDWPFIQSVGGISVGTPKQIESGIWNIPIDCDVSGLRTITVKPTTLNSALVVRKVKSKIQSGTLFIWVITSVVDKQNHSPSATGTTIKNMKPGSYPVEYLNPDGTTIPIKVVEFKTT
jgi:hypothetical protein